MIHQICANTYGKSFVESNQVSGNTLSLGQLFDIVKNTFKSKEPGGVMALSAYGKRNKFINRILKINKNSFTTNTNTIYRMLSYTKENNINFTKENISYVGFLNLCRLGIDRSTTTPYSQLPTKLNFHSRRAGCPSWRFLTRERATTCE